MDKIRETFKKYFGDGVELPENIPAFGKFSDYKYTDWDITYIFRTDENGKKYLDFTADHRMTNPRHCRITEDGELIHLEMYKIDCGYDPKIEGDEEIKKQEYFEYNRNVSRILIEKGLLERRGNESLFEVPVEKKSIEPEKASYIDILFDKLKNLWS